MIQPSDPLQRLFDEDLWVLWIDAFEHFDFSFFMHGLLDARLPFLVVTAIIFLIARCAGLVALFVVGGVAAKNWKVKPTESGEKCLVHAKLMINAERGIGYDRVLNRIMMGFASDSALAEIKLELPEKVQILLRD